MRRSGGRLLCLLGACGLLTGSPAWAFDVDLWRESAGSADPRDPLTAPSAWLLPSGQLNMGLSVHHLRSPLHGYPLLEGCSGSDLAAAAAQSEDCTDALSEALGTDSLGGDVLEPKPLIGTLNTFSLMAERGMSERWALGVRMRGRLAGQEPEDAWPGLDVSTAVGGVDHAGLTDFAVWSHHSLLRGRTSALAVAPELRIDQTSIRSPEFDTTIPDIVWVSGTETGIAVPISLGWEPTIGDADRIPPVRVHAAVGPSVALPDSSEREPVGTRAGVDSWLGASWEATPKVAVLGESALYYAYHAATTGGGAAGTASSGAFSTVSWVNRLGVRYAATERLTVMGVTSVGPHYSPGIGQPHIGLGIEWRQQPLERTPPPKLAGVGEVVIRPLDDKGKRVNVPAPTPDARPAPGGGWIVPTESGKALAVGGGEWSSIEQPVDFEGPGPWEWSPVLFPNEGEAVAIVEVRDVRDTPIAVDSVRYRGIDLGALDAGDQLRLGGLAEGPVELQVDGDLVDGVVVPVTADLDGEADPLYVSTPVGATRVAVAGPSGPISEAKITARSAVDEREVSLSDSGTANVTLAPGRWALRVEATGLGAQEQTLLVEDGNGFVEDVSFNLLPANEDAATLAVAVYDADGNEVSDAEVRLGDAVVGRTASGGVLQIEGLSAGAAALSIDAPRHRELAPATLSLTAGKLSEIEVPLAVDAGVVSMRVRDPEGAPIRDVTVRFIGASTGEPLPLGPDGELETTLDAGAWEAVVSAPERSVQVVDVMVEPERVRRIDLDVVLFTPAPTPGEVAVSVRDGDGRPVEGAKVSLEGQFVGTTSTGGRLVVQGAELGSRDASVEAPMFEVWKGVVEAAAEADDQSIELRPQPGLLQVGASGPEGPLNAWVRLIGPIQTPGYLLGADGARRFALRPGNWEVVLSDPRHGVSLHDVALSPTGGAEVFWKAELVESAGVIAAPERVPVSIEVTDAATGDRIGAKVRLLGSRVLPPLDVSKTEAAVVDLPPGVWEAIASSPAHGVGGADVEVGLEPPPPVEIELGERRATVTSVAVEISDVIEFALDSAELVGRSEGLLSEIARTMRVHPELTSVVIEGHTDDTGDADHNLELSRARAEAVRAWLVEHGVAASRLSTEGYGAERPIADNASQEGRARNRRVAFRIESQRSE